MDEAVAGDDQAGNEVSTVHDVLSNGREDPATEAARKMDRNAFMAGLSILKMWEMSPVGP
jgi:hypothetical protein